MEIQEKKINPASTEKKVLNEQLSEFRQALEDEIRTIEKNGSSSTLLRKGRQLRSDGATFRYEFSAEYMPVMPADTPCKLKIGKDFYDVTVISVIENTIILASNVPLPPSIDSAQLENGSTVLMERLIKRIEDNAEKENAAAKRMLDINNPNIPAPYNTVLHYDDSQLKLEGHNNSQQYCAIKSALENDITYIWGPPGTGKTSVIAQIINNLYRLNRSVLLVSHTNMAVDGALQKLTEKYQYDETPHPILRLGIPSQPLDERLLLEPHIRELGKELFELKEDLEKEKKLVSDELREIEKAFSKQKWLADNQLDDAAALPEKIKWQKADVEKLQKVIAELEAELDAFSQKNPEYEKYEFYRRETERTQREYQSILAELQEKTNKQKALPEEIEFAKDQILLHDRKKELEDRLNALPSHNHLQTTLQKLKSEIAQLEQQEKDYDTKLKAVTQQILEYSQKSGLAKMFANKKAIEYAEVQSRDFKQKLQGIASQKKLKLHVLSDYQRKIETREVLQEELEIITTAQTKEYWEQQYASLCDTQKLLALEIPQLSRRYSEISTMYLENAAHVEAMKEVHQRYTQLSRAMDEYKANLAIAQEQLFEDESNFKSIIRSEIEKCSNWGETIDDLLNEEDSLNFLITLRYKVQEELARFDFEELAEIKGAYEERLKSINTEINELDAKLAQLEKQCIHEAKIIGTTLAKSYLSDVLHERTFDTVIVDEASMASIPALWCACLLASVNIVIVGDFLQLSPVVLAKTPMATKWLAADIFYASGMQERKRIKIQQDNFVALTQQYRMESEIADIANMYYGEYCCLASDDNLEFKKKERDEFYNWYGGKRTKSCIHLLDTSSFHAWVTTIKQGKANASRLNYFSASICVALAFSLIEKKIDEFKAKQERAESPVALIVVPYKPHAKLVEKYIAVYYDNLGCDDLGLVRAGTIHQFQGKEAEIVIFDFVIDEPHWKANLFMNEENSNASLKKMFNVAITRAKFKLYFVGNFQYCLKNAKENAFGELLKYLTVTCKYPVLDAKEMFPHLTFVHKNTIEGNFSEDAKLAICNESDFRDNFLYDLMRAKEQVIIFSPFMTYNRLSEFLPVLVDCISRGVRVIVITKSLDDFGKKEAFTYEKMHNELKELGVIVIPKKGAHEKLLFFDDNVVWNGSLNSLSYTGTTGEIMTRVNDVAFSEMLRQQMKISELLAPFIDASKQHEQLCPLCGKEMWAADGRVDGFYWRCSECDYARSSGQVYPIDGMLHCPECGSVYTFDMKKKPRWICKANHKLRYQYVNYSDFNLPKMKELVPQDRYKEVNEYFVNDGKPAPFQIQQIPAGKARPVIQMTDDGAIIRTYPSIADAVKATHTSGKCIRDAANGVQKHAGGYCWKYADTK